MFIFLAICMSALFRVLLPMFAMQYYTGWVMVSGLFWMVGFAAFVAIYAPILLRPRVDGMFG